MKNKLILFLLLIILLINSGMILGYSDVNECVKIDGDSKQCDCYTTVAKTIDDPDICERCSLGRKNDCYSSIARTKKDPDICEKIDSASWMNKCYSAVALSKLDLNICEKIVDNEQKYGCYTGIAQYKNDPNVCKTIIASEGRDYCYTGLASSQENPDLCNYVIDQEWKDWCYNQFSKTESCDNVNLRISTFCYDYDEEGFKLILDSYGSQAITNLQFGYLIDGVEYVKVWNEGQGLESNFKNGRSANLFAEDNCKLSGRTCPIFIDKGFSSPFLLFNGCDSKKNGIDKIADCEDGKFVWSKGQDFVTIKPASESKPTLEILSTQSLETKSVEEGIEDSPKITLKVFYFVGGFILLAILIFIILKVTKKIKNRPKSVKPKKSEEEVQEQPEIETKSSIPKNISEAISIKNFTVKHGRSLVLDNVDLNIKRGELVSLLGPSGTGKSTIIEAVVGRKSPTKGDIKIFNEDIKNKKIFDHVGFVPQHAELYMNQTVEQNLLSSATKWGIKDAKNKVDDILSTIGLSQRKDLKANKLSGGQLKLLSLAMELIRDPELLILDEPTTGLDPNTRDNIITILSRISTKQNKTVFFTTHFMDDAEECDEVIIIAKAKIVTQGPPSKLEKRLPGHGRVVNIILDNVTDDLLKNIEKIQGVERIISEGRNIKIITEEPNAVKLGQKIDELGGVINKTEITNATMKEVFVYYTGEDIEN